MTAAPAYQCASTSVYVAPAAHRTSVSVLSAIHELDTVSPLHFTITTHKDGADITIEFIHPSDPAAAGTAGVRYEAPAHAEILIAPDVPPSWVRNLTMHELGHAVGIDHDDVGIMVPGLDATTARRRHYTDAEVFTIQQQARACTDA